MIRVAIAVVVTLGLVGCGGSGTEPSERTAAARNETTTTVDPVVVERQAVIGARVEVQRQREYSLRNPSNPEHLALRDFFTDTELLRLVSIAVTNSEVTLADGLGIGVFIGAIYPEGSVHRFEIESVTVSDDRSKAWLETCTVEDYTWHYLNDDKTPHSRADLYVEGLPPVRTTQSTEEMWLVDGRWKLAKVFHNLENADGQSGCAAETGYAKDHVPAGADAETRQAVTDARTAAEAEFVAFLTDPAFPAESATHWTGFQHALYFGNVAFGADGYRDNTEQYCPSDPTLIYTGPGAGTPQQFYMIDDTLNPWRTNPYFAYPPTEVDESPCYADYQSGQQSWAFQTRVAGRIFDPATSSTATVQDLKLQAVADPEVAYLTTCRTYNLVDGADWDLAPYFADRNLTTRSIVGFEVMNLVDGTWKLANRWGFADAGSC